MILLFQKYVKSKQFLLNDVSMTEIIIVVEYIFKIKIEFFEQAKQLDWLELKFLLF